MGRWHAHSLQRIGGFVAVVADPDFARATLLAREFRGARAVASLRDAIASDDIDVVHVCTPPDGRESIVASALHQRRHVLAEKPLASGAARAAELHSLATSSGVILCPVHQFVFQPGALRAAAMRDDIGVLRQFNAVIASAGASDGDDRAQDRLVFDILPHPLSLAERLLDGGTGGVRWNALRSSPGEAAVIGSGSGLALSITVSTHSRPTRNTLHLSGDGGSVYADLFHGFAVVERGAVSRLHKAVRPFTVAGSTLIAASANLAGRAVRRESAFPGLRELVSRFYAAVATGDESPIPASESIGAAAARDNIINLLRFDGALA